MTIFTNCLATMLFTSKWMDVLCCQGWIPDQASGTKRCCVKCLQMMNEWIKYFYINGWVGWIMATCWWDKKLKEVNTEHPRFNLFWMQVIRCRLLVACPSCLLQMCKVPFGVVGQYLYIVRYFVTEFRHENHLVLFRKLLITLGSKWGANPCLLGEGDLHPSWRFLALEIMLRYVICCSCLKLMQMALHCHYIEPLCVSVRRRHLGPWRNVGFWQAGGENMLKPEEFR